MTVDVILDTERRGQPLALPAGVRVSPCEMHADARGVFTEVFRASWDTRINPVQWNAVQSAQGVLRGVHVHPVHDDYLVLVSGHATVGLHDLRPGSPTFGLGAAVDVSVDPITALTIPRGVAHGFYFHSPSLAIYAVSHYWDTADELGCHWADPRLAIQWPCSNPLLSARDANLGPVADLAGLVPAFGTSRG